MKNTNILVLLGLIAATGFTVSQAVLASPPGPPPSPNAPTATFSGVTVTGNTFRGIYAVPSGVTNAEAIKGYIGPANTNSTAVYGQSTGSAGSNGLKGATDTGTAIYGISDASGGKAGYFTHQTAGALHETVTLANETDALAATSYYGGVSNIINSTANLANTAWGVKGRSASTGVKGITEGNTGTPPQVGVWGSTENVDGRGGFFKNDISGATSELGTKTYGIRADAGENLSYPTVAGYFRNAANFVVLGNGTNALDATGAVKVTLPAAMPTAFGLEIHNNITDSQAHGIYATSSEGVGVYGVSTSGSGVKAQSTSGAAITANSTDGVGVDVKNTSTLYPAIWGSNTKGKAGVYGESTSGPGVEGKAYATAASGGVFTNNISSNRVTLADGVDGVVSTLDYFTWNPLTSVGAAIWGKAPQNARAGYFENFTGVNANSRVTLAQGSSAIAVEGIIKSNDTTLLASDPTCGGGIGIDGGDLNCDYPVQVTDPGGLRVLAEDPQMPTGDWNDTRINSTGVSIKTSDGNGLKIDANSIPPGLYHTTFDVTHSGVKTWNTYSDLNNTVNRSFDFQAGNVMDFKNLAWDNSPVIADPTTWNRAADLKLDGVAGKLTLGANNISIGKYKAATSGGAAVYTETSSLDTTTAGTLKVNGNITATGGIGRTYINSGPLTPAAPGSMLAYGYSSAYVGCGSDKLLSCSFSTASTYSLVQADQILYTNGCYVYVKNVTATATGLNFTPKAICISGN